MKLSKKVKIQFIKKTNYYFKSSSLLIILIATSLYGYKSTSNSKNSKDHFVVSQNTQNDSLEFNKEYTQALNLLKKEKYVDALKLSFILKNKLNNGNSLINEYKLYKLIADIYDKTRDYNKSLLYYKLSLKVVLKNNLFFDNKNNNLETYLAGIYLKIGANFQKKANLDSAKYFYSKIENLQSLNHDFLKSKALTYTNLSAIHELDSSYNKAKSYILKAIEMHKTRGDKENQANSLNNLGNIFLSLKNYDEAKLTYLKGIKLINNNNSPKAVRFKANLYYNLAWAMRNLKDYKAYDYQELSYEIGDSEKEKDVRKIIAQITASHKETLEQQKVDLVKSQTELLKVQKNKSTLLVSILSILGLIISGVVIYNYRLRQNNLQLKLSQNKLIEEQNIDRIKSESQIKILNATIDGKETERKQIAETLHDSVSALLSSANMHLRATKKQFNGNTPVELEKTQQIILEASQKVRDLSHNLVSSILLKFGLGYAIKDIGSKYSNSELHFHTNISNISRYNQEFEIKLYNVIHELINNILKHSKASNAHIVLEDKNGFLSVLIEDDGIGFNYKDNKIKTGLGLNQIEARIQMMNGNFLIESAKEKGTKATITVPIKTRSLVTA
ncbi:tetratricopeptide repeat-containing sensor histidine kinase [Tenacibaculum halocynthiae]|uniref:tetratricopeptide repeat-containing sensor histidine kinase n=1 Tax=Tenacibaculum halocynthiae TaxID=1254437 RepID=UPI003D65E278